jgi:hypothetical protein
MRNTQQSEGGVIIKVIFVVLVACILGAISPRSLLGALLGLGVVWLINDKKWQG